MGHHTGEKPMNLCHHLNAEEKHSSMHNSVTVYGQNKFSIVNQKKKLPLVY